MDPSEDPTTARNSAFRKANERQNELVRAGVSQSGHERNCCFLNTGGERFANVSAAVGLDHVGDGRAYALVDWDQDGDLDLWATNRTAPRAQFLRNNSLADHHFLNLKLVGNGTTTNRDAIGARVEIKLSGDPRPIIKSLRAGEGFLSQSSKVVHFGLGDYGEIEQAVVHWPGGTSEEIAGLKADQTYCIVQGRGVAETWSRPTPMAPLKASENESPPRTDLARIPLRFPIPLQKLEFTTFEGKRTSFEDYRGSPTLINFWASWCRPCLAELAELRDREEALRTLKLNVVALSIDGLAEDQQANPEVAKQILQQLHVPFECGMAAPELIDKLELVVNHLFDYRRPWAAPTSFLLDKEGRLAAIYVGRVDLEELMSDAEQLQQDQKTWLQATLPFPGIWADDRRLPDMWPFVKKLFDSGRASDAAEYFSQLEKLQAPSDAYADLLVRVGAALNAQGDLASAAERLKQAIAVAPTSAVAEVQLANVLTRLGRIDEALLHCRKALQIDPDNVDAHNGLGSLLRTQGNLDEAIRHLLRAIELKPNHAEALLTLGAIYIAQQKWDDAVVRLQEAVKANPESPDAHRELGRALRKTGRDADAVLHLERAARLNPDDVDALYALGAALASAGRTDEAIVNLRKAHAVRADSLLVTNGLAWMLATRPEATQREGAEAVEFAEKAASKTDRKHPQILDTLAAAYAASGDFDKAVSTARLAADLATSAGSAELANEIRMRLQLYQQREPYREIQATH